MELYKSKIGEVQTKDYWVSWFKGSFSYAVKGMPERAGFKAPSNEWERVVKILKLERISNE